MYSNNIIERSVVTCPADISPRDGSDKAVFCGLPGDGADDASLPTQITIDLSSRSESSSSLSSMEEEADDSSVIVSNPPFKNTTNMKKRVRFAVVAEESSSSTDNKNSTNNNDKKTKRKIADVDSTQWWTREELQDIHQTFVFAVKTREHDIPPGDDDEKKVLEEEDALLEHFSSRSRKRRKIVRSQMVSTIEAVRTFETSANAKTSPEMLSQLLERHSAPMALEAFEKAKFATKAQQRAKKTKTTPSAAATKIVSSYALPTTKKAFPSPRLSWSSAGMLPSSSDNALAPRAA